MKKCFLRRFFGESVGVEKKQEENEWEKQNEILNR